MFTFLSTFVQDGRASHLIADALSGFEHQCM